MPLITFWDLSRMAFTTSESPLVDKHTCPPVPSCPLCLSPEAGLGHLQVTFQFDDRCNAPDSEPPTSGSAAAVTLSLILQRSPCHFQKDTTFLLTQLKMTLVHLIQITSWLIRSLLTLCHCRPHSCTLHQKTEVWWGPEQGARVTLTQRWSVCPQWLPPGSGFHYQQACATGSPDSVGYQNSRSNTLPFSSSV